MFALGTVLCHPAGVTEFTRILDQVQQGDPKAAGDLLPSVYDELRKLAAAKMAHQPSRRRPAFMMPSSG